MKKSYKLTLSAACICISLAFLSCKEKKVSEKDAFLKDNITFAEEQTKLMLKTVGEPTGKNYPRSMDDEGKLVTTGMYDWTPGFFPGNLWYLYELSGDTIWRNEAEKWTNTLEPLKTFTGHHDLGFMIYCSYGNAERLAPKPQYKDIIIESAKSLSSRYSEKTQTIKSWDYRLAWDGVTEWFYPVIMDNMMNLEMLFNATKLSGDKRYYDIAVKHADSTIKNHFREDFSSYHVVNYDTITGKALNKANFQGFSDNSTWARGQAWAIYGFTMVYRETQDKKYLEVAEKAADWYLKHLPADLVPLWDFNVGEAGYIPGKMSYAAEFQEKLKDVSSAAIVASAFFELGEVTKNKMYTDKAIEMLQVLSKPPYRAELGKNADFILTESVGSIPHKTEINKPLVYADYYYLEALARYKKLESK